MSKDFLKFNNPKKTNIYINGNKLITCQILNYKISEDKTPIYGFHNSEYSDVIRGKKIVEGLIAIKKHSAEQIGSLILSRGISKEYERRVEFLEEKKKKLYEIGEIFGGLNSEFSDFQLERIKNLEQITQTDFENQDFLDATHGKNIKLSIEYKDSENESKISFKNVHFVSKQGEVELQKATIFEVYNFFANKDSNKNTT